MATATAKAKREHLTEFTAGVGGNVDTENHVIRNVKILGAQSKNGRTYTESAMRQAVALYEGAKVNVNHPKGRPDQPRDYQDRIGYLKGVNYRESALYGDFHYNPKHPLAEQVVYDAQHAPNNSGFSHNVQASTSRQNGRTVVESITKVTSVDLVADPATTSGLYEHTEEPDAMSLTEATLEQIKSARPDLVTAILEDAKSGDESKERDKQFALLEAEVKTLRAEKAASERKAAVDSKLTEAKLPSEVLTEKMRKLAHGMEDAELVEFIEELKGIAKGVPSKPSGQKPKSSEQTQVTEGVLPQVIDTKSFVSALRA